MVNGEISMLVEELKEFFQKLQELPNHGFYPRFSRHNWHDLYPIVLSQSKEPNIARPWKEVAFEPMEALVFYETGVRPKDHWEAAEKLGISPLYAGLINKAANGIIQTEAADYIRSIRSKLLETLNLQEKS